MIFNIPVEGKLTVYRGRHNIYDTMYAVKNAIATPLFVNLADVIINRQIEYGLDAIAWGSYVAPVGSYVDSDWAGTTSTGTKGALIQSRVSNLISVIGTFSFGATKQINMFRTGRGYTPAAPAVTELFTTLYNYDTSLLTGSTYLTYESGDTMIIDWKTLVG